MKLRREPRGHHFYERVSGVHILVDEMPIDRSTCDVGPEIVSIALLNACDLECPFCYAPKTPFRLDSEHVVDLCRQFAAMGALEVAFGGGEPTLYRGLSDLCRRIWTETDLGISITTHGHHLSEQLIDELKGQVSVIRVSVDGPEPIYSSVRGRRLSDLLKVFELLRGRIPFAVNTVINGDTLKVLDELAAQIEHWGAVDWLLLPETSEGQFLMTTEQWSILDCWIAANWSRIPLRVSTDAVQHLSCPFPLETDSTSYIHVRADGSMSRCSYGSGGIHLEGRSLQEAIAELACCPSGLPPLVRIQR